MRVERKEDRGYVRRIKSGREAKREESLSF